jgi:hypothetical protein
MPTGDLDLRVKVRVDNGTIPNIYFSKMDNGGNFGFRLTQDASWAGRKLRLEYSTTGANLATVLSSTTLDSNGIADGTIFWARVTVKLNTAEASKTFTFYTSLDGNIWTPLGIPITSSDTGAAPFASSLANCYLGGWGGITQFSGAVYAVEIRSGIDGPPGHPLNIDAWQFNEGTATLKGAPELWVSNAAWPGAAVDNFNAQAPATYCRNYTPQIILISLSHNSPRERGPRFFNKIKLLVTNVRGQLGEIPKIIFVTQNPQIRLSAPIDPEAQHQDALAYHRAQFMSWANNSGHGIIDTWSAFEKDPRPLEELVGTIVWAAKPVTGIAVAGNVATVQISDMSMMAPFSPRGITIVGAKKPDGSKSGYNGVWSFLSKSTNTTGPGWVTMSCSLNEPVDLAAATAAPCDAVHPTFDGYQLWANTVLAAFLRGTP